MRFKGYITEQKSFAEWAPSIEKECSKYIKEIKGAKGALFRLVTMGNNPVIKKKTHANRKPLDTFENIHIGIDELFYKKFGWRARSNYVSFCWGSRFTSANTNFNGIFFPVGDYKYLWSSKVYDLNVSLDSPEKWEFHGKNAKNTYDYIKSFEKKYLNTYTDKNLKKAVVSGNEVMINCKEYYLIRPELIELVDNTFDLRWQGAKFTGRRL